MGKGGEEGSECVCESWLASVVSLGVGIETLTFETSFPPLLSLFEPHSKPKPLLFKPHSSPSLPSPLSSPSPSLCPSLLPPGSVSKRRVRSR